MATGTSGYVSAQRHFNISNTRKKRNMAIVRRLEYLALEKDSPHSEVECTYSIVGDDDGGRFLQVDTYGSKLRQIPGKKSQSIRFAPEAIEQLKALLAEKF
jgi:hypothetical protein